MVSKAGRKLQVGDEAYTDYKRGITVVRIVDRIDGTRSQSGICFRVDPPLEQYDPRAMYDADWFEPAPRDFL